MAISFNAIPIDLRAPGAYIEIDNSRAVQGLPGMPSRILVLGQMLSTGTATALEPIDILTGDQAAGYFGRGSMLHRMAHFLRANNTVTRATVIPMEDDGAAQAATGTLAITGPATASGTLVLWIAGQRVRVGVAAGTAATAIATATAAAINAVLDLPVTAAATAADVTLTCRWSGETGNAIDIRVGYYGEAMPAGVGLTITPMSGGSANPDLTAALAAIGDEWVTDIILPYTDTASLAAIEAELETRFGPLVMQDAHAYAWAQGTHAELTTLGDSRNSPHLTIMGMDGSPTPPWEAAAALGAVAAYHLQIDPARPLQTLELRGVLPPAEADRFTMEERNLLLHDGIATARTEVNTVQIDRAITTFQTNQWGIEDISYLDVTTLKTLAYLRYSVRARIFQRFPRHKLASDGTRYGPGQAIVTPAVIRDELVALFREWETAGLVEQADQFKSELIVERDQSDPNRVNALIPPDVINQFRVFAGQVQFRL
ncbi:phage tail sheath subtilisin-like domain-containing protein [Roseospira navarrensis]|uniref:Phage tail protein n=1 Tax=Roseospira navarrensis TaxID=140058 RepID=A0A7X2D3H6_9PROT|nr:phage tail sheath subtilisin-like domain-containing protein [Roseospira navarrensis]MQX36818.1 phage tail protein [Roseospira navarrensis]